MYKIVFIDIFLIKIILMKIYNYKYNINVLNGLDFNCKYLFKIIIVYVKFIKYSYNLDELKIKLKYNFIIGYI